MLQATYLGVAIQPEAQQTAPDARSKDAFIDRVRRISPVATAPVQSIAPQLPAASNDAIYQPGVVTDPALLVSTDGEKPPWYKNWKIMVPAGVGGVLAVGALVWAVK